MSRRVRAVLACSSLAVASAAVLAPPASAAGLLPLNRPATIGVGADFTVALAPNGTVRSWGGNTDGDLGNGSTTSSPVPVQVKGINGSGLLDHVVQVAAGDLDGAALRSDGTIATWGYGGTGQLGNDGMWDVHVPVLVHSTTGSGVLTGAVSVAEGDSSAMALLTDGTVVTWGNNGNGELGDGTTNTRLHAGRVLAPSGAGYLSHVVAISAGAYTDYAVTNTGAVYAWGYDGQGQLGDNDSGFAQRTRPVQVVGVGGTGTLSGVVQVAGGIEHALALRSDGSVVGWGSSGSGQLGTGSTSPAIHQAPVAITSLGTHIAYVAAGEDAYHSIAVTSGGLVYVFGYNAVGQLGDGTTTERDSPVQLVALTTQNVVMAAADSYDSAVVTSSGTVYDFGRNDSGQLGNSTFVSSTGISRATALPAVGLPKLYLRTAPVLSGHGQVGQTLTVTSGVWGLPATSHAYQWLRDGRAIHGATHSTYKQTPADRHHHVSVQVFGSRIGYARNGTTTRAVYVSK